MKNDQSGSQDRKTRTDSEGTVHHTVGGSIRHGDLNEPIRGLTAEQTNEQRSGIKLDERQTRENAVTADGKKGSSDLSASFGGKEKTRDRS